MYLPAAQSNWNPMMLTVRSDAPAASLLSGVRTIVSSLDPLVPVSGARSMQEMIAAGASARRFNMTLLLAFAGLALALALVGSYGVMAYAVAQRRHEFGVRLALGASRADIRAMVLRHAAALTAAAVAIGVPAAFGLTRLLDTLLFGVTARDPIVFVSVPLLLSMAVLAASWVPARRAIRVDPLAVLRQE
jgi:ABC-type antimicrobial peptide transport system permease subunit